MPVPVESPPPPPPIKAIGLTYEQNQERHLAYARELYALGHLTLEQLEDRVSAMLQGHYEWSWRPT